MMKEEEVRVSAPEEDAEESPFVNIEEEIREIQPASWWRAVSFDLECEKTSAGGMG